MSHTVDCVFQTSNHTTHDLPWFHILHTCLMVTRLKYAMHCDIMSNLEVGHREVDFPPQLNTLHSTTIKSDSILLQYCSGNGVVEHCISPQHRCSGVWLDLCNQHIVTEVHVKIVLRLCGAVHYNRVPLQNEVKSQYVQISNILDISIKRPILGQSTPMVNRLYAIIIALYNEHHAYNKWKE